MRKIKKALALSLALAMGLSLCACGEKDDDKTTESTTESTTEATTEGGSSEDASTEEGGGEESGVPFDLEKAAAGETIYVYSWNDELGNRIDSHFRTRYPDLSDKVVYRNLNVKGTEDAYSQKIQNAAETGDEYPSVFASDESLVKSYAAKDYTAPVSEAGITAEMYSNAYQYTVDFATIDGNLMACTWQATPGILCYNKAMAEEVLGTSDPVEVQEMVKDWDSFFATADKIKEAGYYMLSGADELKYPYLANKEEAWVVDGKLVISDTVKEGLEMAKKAWDGGYTKQVDQWSTDWTANMSNNTVFCFFGTTWFMSDTVFVTEDVKYQTCAGPMGYYWGGSYLLYGKDCPNPELAGLLIYTLTCDTDAMYDIIKDDADFCNNQEAVARAIANGDGALDKLDGQNPYEAFDAGAKMIDMSKSTAYDSQINNSYSTVSGGYNTGKYANIDEAVAALKADVAATITDIVVE